MQANRWPRRLAVKGGSGPGSERWSSALVALIIEPPLNKHASRSLRTPPRAPGESRAERERSPLFFRKPGELGPIPSIPPTGKLRPRE